MMDERRTEPRFRVDGRVEIQHAGSPLQADIVDLSLNGALLRLPADHALAPEMPLQVQVWIDGTCHFQAEAAVAHVQGERIGIEFTGMSTVDFDVFSGLILLLARQRIDVIA